MPCGLTAQRPVPAPAAGRVPLPVASLTLLSPGAVTDGVTLFFIVINCNCYYYFISPYSYCKFSRKKYTFIRVGADRPPGWCHPGRSALPRPALPPLVTPLTFTCIGYIRQRQTVHASFS